MAWVKRTTTREDCLDLVTRIRDEDLKEVLASRPRGLPDDTLWESVKLSYKCYSVMEDGIGCIAIFGVRKTSLGGVPWMICSDYLFENNSRAFAKQCRAYMRELTEDFELSFNHVAVTNTVAHRWLTWMGFTVYKTHTNTVNGVVFYPFAYRRK